MKKLYNAALLYLILGLALGIFAREYTKMHSFEGFTMLNLMHTHILVLGFLFFLIALTLTKVFTIPQTKSFNIWFIVYNLGLILTGTTMAIRGFLQVNETDLNGLNHMAGLSHIIISVGLIWFMILLGKAFKK
ncbi:MAG: DUF2871 domain-containing protein [Bacillaceae bacterium]